MANDYQLIARLGADVTGFQKGMSQAAKSLTDLQNTAGKQIQAIGQSVTNAGQTLTAGITLPLAGIGTATVKTGLTFDQQMRQVQAISQATGQEFDALREQAIQLGADSIFGAKRKWPVTKKLVA